MRHRCTVVVSSADGQMVLAEPVGSAWLLPMVVDRVRLRPTHLVGRLLSMLGGRFYVAMLGEAFLAKDTDTLESSVLVLPVAGCMDGAPLRWVDADTCAAFVLVPAQARALEACRRASVDRFAVAGGEQHWLPAVQAWATTIVTDPLGSDFEQYRAPPDRITMRLGPAEGHHVFFKALPRASHYEHDLAEAIDRLSPGSVPRALAFDEPRTWRLEEAVAGASLADSLTQDQAAAAAYDMGRLHRRLQTAVPRLREHGVPILSWSTICHDITQACTDVRIARNTNDCPTAEVIDLDLDDLEARLRQACEATAALEIVSWLDLDADPRNLVIRPDGRLAWIDLEASCIGPPGVGLEGFLVRLETFLPASRPWADALRDRYRAGWGERASAWQTSSVREQRTAFHAAQLARRIAVTRRQLISARLHASFGQLLAHNLVRLDQQLRAVLDG